MAYSFTPVLFKLLCLKLRQSPPFFFWLISMGVHITQLAHTLFLVPKIWTTWRVVSGTSLHYLLYNQGGPPVAPNVLWLLLIPVLEAVSAPSLLVVSGRVP